MGGENSQQLRLLLELSSRPQDVEAARVKIPRPHEVSFYFSLPNTPTKGHQKAED